MPLTQSLSRLAKSGEPRRQIFFSVSLDPEATGAFLHFIMLPNKPKDKAKPATSEKPTCPWRIANLPGIPRVFAFLLRCGNARSRDPFHPSHHDRRPTCESGRRPFHSCRVRPRQTSTADPQSLAPARSQSPPSGSHRCRLVRSIYAAVPADPFGHRPEAVDPSAPSPDPDQAQVPPAFLPERQAQARSQGSLQRTH